jgi:hypothetical protein
MPYKSIKKELVSLCTGEIVASITFIIALISVKSNLGVSVDAIILYPFSILVFILSQGSYYWFYRLRNINRKRVKQYRFRFAYRVLKKTDLILIILYPVIILYELLLGNLVLVSGKTLVSFFIYIFSIIEYINYFYIRLSYGKLNDIVMLLKLKNLKKSSLNKELRK